MNLKKLLLVMTMIAALQDGSAWATECAIPAQRFIPQPEIEPPAQRFIPQVPVVPRQTFYPYVPRISSAPQAPLPIYAEPAQRFIPQPNLLPQPQYVSPADREQPAQRFIPNPQILPEVERIYPCNCS